MYNKAIFFDRDGVINKLVERNNGFFSPRTFSEFEFYEDIESCINFLAEKGFLILIISNQPDISRNRMSINELDKIDKLIMQKLRINEICYSFESEVSDSGTKKPSPKMVLDAAKKWEIDLSKSFFIGDSIADQKCACNANVPFILIQRDHNKDIKSENIVTSLMQINFLIN